MLNENSVVKLNKNVLKRFEQDIKDGTLFLFDLETEGVWVGNSSSNDLIKLLDGKRTLKEVYTGLQKEFEGYEYTELKNCFDSIIKDLLDKQFLEYVDFSVC